MTRKPDVHRHPSLEEIARVRSLPGAPAVIAYLKSARAVAETTEDTVTARERFWIGSHWRGWKRARINGEWQMTKVVGQAIAVRHLNWLERLWFTLCEIAS